METIKSYLVPILVILLLVTGVTAFTFYQQLTALKTNPQATAQKEIKELVAQVSKLIILPQGEDPTVATVTDLEKLKGQLFFANAKKGDKLLIYSTARKAFLYNPTENRIVEVAPLNIGNPLPPAPAPAPTPKTTTTTKTTNPTPTTPTTGN